MWRKVKKKIDLEFVLQSFKKLADKYNFEVSIPVTILKDGTLIIDQIDVKVKNFLSFFRYYEQNWRFKRFGWWNSR